MRTLGGISYLLIIGLVAVATDRMAVTLYDRTSPYRHDPALAWPSAAKTPTAPATACVKPAPTGISGDTRGCPAAVVAPAATDHLPLDRITDLWAAIRRL